MDKLKGKYEIILGFVTLIVSLSAFKDELSLINLNLGFFTLSLAQFFLYCVLGLSICLYLYIIEHIVRDTKIGGWKIFDYIIRLAFYIFTFIILTPFFLLLDVIIYNIYKLTSQNEIFLGLMPHFLSEIISGLVMLSLSKYFAEMFRENFSEKSQEEIELREIIELDNAHKLFIDGYYSQSILETYKLLETHLYKKITEKKIRVSRYRIDDILKIALKEKIISENDLNYIQDIRQMRNIAAHTQAKQTREEAEKALKFAQTIIDNNQ